MLRGLQLSSCALYSHDKTLTESDMRRQYCILQITVYQGKTAGTEAEATEECCLLACLHMACSMCFFYTTQHHLPQVVLPRGPGTSYINHNQENALQTYLQASLMEEACPSMNWGSLFPDDSTLYHELDKNLTSTQTNMITNIGIQNIKKHCKSELRM